MYQATTGAAIAITERVDCLKLGMGNRGLRNSRDVVEVHKPDEIIQQRLYVLGRRRDERRISWAKPCDLRSSSALHGPRLHSALPQCPPGASGGYL